MPPSTRSDWARTGFHQSAYSSQCAVGVQHKSRALSSARPSGAENVYKIDAESFRGPAQLDAMVREGQQIVTDAPA